MTEQSFTMGTSWRFGKGGGRKGVSLICSALFENKSEKSGYSRNKERKSEQIRRKRNKSEEIGETPSGGAAPNFNLVNFRHSGEPKIRKTGKF